MEKEYDYNGLLINGFAMLFFTFILIPAIAIVAIVLGGEEYPAVSIGVSIPMFIIFILGCSGYFVQQPNESRVMIFFGKYVGTCRKVGFYWTNPFVTRKRVSLRIHNTDIEPTKVNDKVGNPVLIGMVLVWKIRDTYRVSFDLDSDCSPTKFVNIQSEAALREIAGEFAYDPTGSAHDELTLRDGGEQINDLLERKINDRLTIAGIEAVEARINYLAYAPEIAAVMLKRQQAAAVITAREKIVEGAVTMVEEALNQIQNRKIVDLSDQQKAQLVGNLLVVLCGDEPAQPVINT